MIVCSCNVLSDQHVRSVVEAERTRSTSQVYGCLGCNAQCGRCARTVRRLMDETLGNARDAASGALCAGNEVSAVDLKDRSSMDRAAAPPQRKRVEQC